MLTTDQYLELVTKRSQEGKPLSRVYRNIRNLDLFLTAYDNLHRNKGAMTAGTDKNDTVDGMSIERINTIIEQLKEGTFKWKPSRREYIDKPDGGKRPLSIPSWTDKLVQEVIRMVLEAYYEPKFLDCSHGFRPKRGCHTALYTIREKWKGAKWFIEGDIKGCFSNIGHEILLSTIARDIKDERLIKLLREMLKAGYLENWTYHITHSGTPQGGVVSPILANIYLNELDCYVQDLITAHTQGIRRRPNPEWTNLRYKEKQLRKKGRIAEADKVRKVWRTLPSGDPQDANYRRLRYMRYADDFILAYIGPKSEAKAIKTDIQRFLAETLKLELSTEKTLITHAVTEKARFLGYEVYVQMNNTKIAMGGGGMQRTVNGRIALRVPKEVIFKWIRQVSRNGKPADRPALLHHPDFDIIATYKAEFDGLCNYYQMAINASDLNRVKSAYLESALRTLAAKHQAKMTKIYRKYVEKNEPGMKTHIKIVVERKDKAPKIIRLGHRSIVYVRKPAYIVDEMETSMIRRKRSSLIERLLAEECELCGAQNVPIEMHHVNKLKDLKKKYKGKTPPRWVITMTAMRRKTLATCERCHTLIETGKYDGIRVK